MADISNITVSVEGVNTVCEIKDKVARNDIALNRTTLGTQCKNLFDWKNATYSTSLRLTQTKTESGISVTSTGSWAVTAYKLPVLEVGTNYIFSTTISDLSVAGGKAYVVISTSTSSSNIVKAAEITNNGTATIKFEATSNTMYVLFYPNYSDTVYTNSFTASNIMLRYADITDDTYEPYKESVDERLINNTSDIAINKSTLGYQRKNLLKPTSSKTRAGITYTVNEDGSVTLTGTSTTGSSYNYFSIPITLQAGKYKVNGMPETSKTNTYRVDLRATESGGTAYGYGAKEFEVEFTETTTAYYMIRIDGSYKNPLDGVIFYPMIRYADILDDTYEPYQPSVQEQINALEARIAALGG